MTKRASLVLWLSAALSLLAALYAGGNVIFYAWLTAAAPERWSAERAAPFVYGALSLAVLFLLAFICCVVTLVREANRKYRLEQDAT
jgi:hypothetical protein